MKTTRIFLSLALSLALLPTGIVSAAATNSVSISGAPIAGTTVSLSGAATLTSGNIGSTHEITVSWGDTTSTTDLAITNNVGDNTSGTWSSSHLYSTPGSYTITVSLIKSSNSSVVTTTSQGIVIPKQNPTITWNNPSAITYGTALSGTQLNASASVAGAFLYSPALTDILNAGNGQTLSVHFTPTDTANYNEADKSVTINVNSGTQTINWSNPADVVAGTLLSATELNANVTVSGPDSAGTIIYSPALGTQLNVAGSQTLNADVGATSNYNAATQKTVSINVLPGAASTAAITASQTTTEAPGSVTLTIVVKDSFGNNVADGTAITLTSNFGTVSGSGTTVSGSVTRTLGSTSIGGATLDVTGLTTSGDTAIVFVDTTAPLLDIVGGNMLTVWVNNAYSDPVASSTDAVDGNLSSFVTIDSSSVDTSTIGTYFVDYDVTDLSGNTNHKVLTVNVVDVDVPIITLLGSTPVYVEVGTTYTDAGATATDNVDGDLTSSIITTGLPVNTSALGTTTVSYNVSDSSLNPAGTVTREVVVRDTIAPVLTLTGASSYSILVGGSYSEPGYTASDNFDATVNNGSVVVTGSVNTGLAGIYVINYSVTDGSGNTTSVNRTVDVHPAATDATLSALSSATGSLTPAFASTTLAYTVSLPFGSTLTPVVSATTTDANATFVITNASDITASTTAASRTTIIEVTAEDGTTKQIYSIVYNVQAVPDTTAPVITLLGSTPVTLTVGDTYSDAGATAMDNIDGDITSLIIVVNNVNTAVAGDYSVIYNVSDTAGNSAASLTRIVSVLAPVSDTVTTTGGTSGGGRGSSNNTSPINTISSDDILIDISELFVNQSIEEVVSQSAVVNAATLTSNTVAQATSNTGANNTASVVLADVGTSTQPTQTASVFSAFGDSIPTPIKWVGGGVVVLGLIWAGLKFVLGVI